MTKAVQEVKKDVNGETLEIEYPNHAPMRVKEVQFRSESLNPGQALGLLKVVSRYQAFQLDLDFQVSRGSS